jgi:hypothetical protein
MTDDMVHLTPSVSDAAGPAVAISNKAKLSLYKKSLNTGLSLAILEEVYTRGIKDWSEKTNHTPEQHAFGRVNSFISGGLAAELDHDLLEAADSPSKREDGTAALVKKYVKDTPGQKMKLEHAIRNILEAKKKKKSDEKEVGTGETKVDVNPTLKAPELEEALSDKAKKIGRVASVAATLASPHAGKAVDAALTGHELKKNNNIAYAAATVAPYAVRNLKNPALNSLASAVKADDANRGEDEFARQKRYEAKKRSENAGVSKVLATSEEVETPYKTSKEKHLYNLKRFRAVIEDEKEMTDEVVFSEAELEHFAQIDEISREKAKRYIDASQKDVNKEIRKHGVYKAEASKRVHNRYKGQDTASAKLGKYRWEGPARVPATEELEQIDELSRKTLGSYVKKASSDMNDAAFDAGKAHPKNSKKEKKFAYQADVRAQKRLKGLHAAADRLAKEELEQIDEISKKRVRAYLDKAYDQLSSADDGRHGEKTYNSEVERKRDRGATLAVNKMYGGARVNASGPHEEVEQVDEVSKGKLSQYIGKATDKVFSLGAKRGSEIAHRGVSHIDSPEHRDDVRKTNNRVDGVKRAADKLAGNARVNAAEEVEQVDELSKNVLGKYVNKSNADFGKKVETHPPSSNKLKNRLLGVRTAHDKMSKHPSSRVKATEEVEQIDEKSVTAHRAGETKKMFAAADRMAQFLKREKVKEEVEQVDEISKEKLKRYASKADDQSSDALHKSYGWETGRYGRGGHRDLADTYRKIAHKREDGYNRAKAKLEKSKDVKVHASEETSLTKEVHKTSLEATKQRGLAIKKAKPTATAEDVDPIKQLADMISTDSNVRDGIYR